MNRKTVSGTILIILLVGIFAFSIQLPKASGTIYIREDGSIYPDDGRIITEDSVHYDFTEDIHDNIRIERSNIIVDGGGHALEGLGSGSGIYLSERSNVTIKNMEIREFDDGVELRMSSFCHIFENHITNCDDYGMYAYESTNNTITGNTVIICYDYGFMFVRSSNNTITKNNLTDNESGFALHESTNNTITGNKIAANDIFGIYMSDESTNNTITKNNITNNQYGIFLSQNCTNNTITVNNMTDSITVDHSSSNIITGNSMAAGMNLDYSSSNIITGNSMAARMTVDHSSSNIITGNSITAASISGIWIYTSTNNTISGNNIVNNDATGILVRYSTNNTIIGNNITANLGEGMVLESSSTNNTITGNTISNNEGGIAVRDSSNNSIYHNSFINNKRYQAQFSGKGENFWDCGYPVGGNYWSDHEDTDKYWSEYQNLDGSDMIGDTPYVINENNTDMYPLTEPWPMSNWWGFEDYSVVAITSSSITNFSFNKTLGEISFNVTTGTSDYCKVIVSKWLLDGAFNSFIDNVISGCPVSWSSGWHMINFPYNQGNHGIRIMGEYASPCLPEFPDIIRDGVIDIFDVVAVASKFGTKLQ